MSKHTPGPWDVYEEGRIGKSGPAPAYIEVRADKHTAVCTLFPHAGAGGAGVDTSRANARLIAVSPKLLAACIAVNKCGNGGAKLSRAASDLVRAAIREAEGPEEVGEQVIAAGDGTPSH